MLTNEQVSALLKPIDPGRVKQDGKGFSHVEAWDIRRTMNQIFGFAKWSSEVTDMELISQTEVVTRGGKPAWNVIYRARCEVRVGEGLDGGAYAEWAAGDATNPTLADAHDQAIKTAESQAFKRACVNLGDQFGLSLYADGSTQATVGDVVGVPRADSEHVENWLRILKTGSEADVQALLPILREAEVTVSEKAILVEAYKASQGRLADA